MTLSICAAEFTAVGDMFAIVIGSIRWPMVVLIGLVSAGYTAYGGLYVSIVTDQVRGGLPLGSSLSTESQSVAATHAQMVLLC